MTIFIDTEFLDDGRAIDLISIAVVTHQGDEFMAYNQDADLVRAARVPWMRENVFKALPLDPEAGYPRFLDVPLVMPHREIGRSLTAWLESVDAIAETGDWWGYYPAHDLVALAQLYGPLTSAPDIIPMRINCLEQWYRQLGAPKDIKPLQSVEEHDAMVDARWCKIFHRYLTRYAETRR